MLIRSWTTADCSPSTRDVYKRQVGNSAVQQVYTGKNFYHADTAVVMTNSWLTAQARQEAAHLDVILWDRQNFEHNSFPVRSGKRS